MGFHSYAALSPVLSLKTDKDIKLTGFIDSPGKGKEKKKRGIEYTEQ